MCLLIFAFRDCYCLGSFILQLICFKSLSICFRGTKYKTFRERFPSFSISCVAVRQLNKLFCIELSSSLTSLALTCDEQYLLVGDGNGSCIHLCQEEKRIETENSFDYSSPHGCCSDRWLNRVLVLQQRARTVQLKERRDAWGYRNPNNSVWRKCRPS